MLRSLQEKRQRLFLLAFKTLNNNKKLNHRKTNWEDSSPSMLQELTQDLPSPKSKHLPFKTSLLQEKIPVLSHTHYVNLLIINKKPSQDNNPKSICTQLNKIKLFWTNKPNNTQEFNLRHKLFKIKCLLWKSKMLPSPNLLFFPKKNLKRSTTTLMLIFLCHHLCWTMKHTAMLPSSFLISTQCNEW